MIEVGIELDLMMMMLYRCLFGAKAGRKTRASLARSTRLIIGSARLGSLKNINEPRQGFSSVCY